MPSRNQLIQLIHIAKNQLALDDETYRLMLQAETDKASCKKMSQTELEKVLSAMEQRGFKRRFNGRKNRFNKRLSPKSQGVRTEIDRIRAIWISMSKHGFIRDGSETALDAYVRRMTNRNKNEGVDHVAWCNANQAHTVLESLKNWHRRVMVDAIKDRQWTVPTSEKTGKTAGYEVILETYNDMIAPSEEANK